jgi:hypothetical protein
MIDIETVTAEIRVLRIDRRNVTLSMFRQLDEVSAWHIKPLGRVRSGVKYEGSYGAKYEAKLEVIGTRAGVLVKAVVREHLDGVPGMGRPAHYESQDKKDRFDELEAQWKVRLLELRDLPLILL